MSYVIMKSNTFWILWENPSTLIFDDFCIVCCTPDISKVTLDLLQGKLLENKFYWACNRSNVATSRSIQLMIKRGIRTESIGDNDINLMVFWMHLVLTLLFSKDFRSELIHSSKILQYYKCIIYHFHNNKAPWISSWWQFTIPDMRTFWFNYTSTQNNLRQT